VDEFVIRAVLILYRRAGAHTPNGTLLGTDSFE
jgi:hypothetical protein